MIDHRTPWVRWLILVAVTSVVTGFGKPEHSTVAVVHRHHQGNELWEFKVSPKEGMVITDDAPWTLKIQDIKGVSLTETDLSSEAYDKSIAGFRVQGSRSDDDRKLEEVEFSYRLRSFVCTEDKSRCYPQIHEGSFKKKL